VNRDLLLFVGEIRIGSTTHGRVDGLREAGFDVIHLGTDPWLRHPWRWLRGLEHRLNFGPLIYDFNRHLLNEVSKTAPGVVWIDKGIWVSGRTIREIRALGATAVHYTPDPAIAFHATRKFRSAVPQYDVLFTSKAWEIDLYRSHGARRVVFSQMVTDEKTRRPIELTAEERATYGSDVVFIGHSEPHYVSTLVELIRRLPNLDVKIWGDWGRAVTKHPELRTRWQGGLVLGDDYCRALSGAKIALGLLSKLIPETETSRSFEIPACRSFLLAERTPSHQRLFQEGQEAEFFADLDEAEAKIRRYLGDDAARTAIAHAGHGRLFNSGYLCRNAMAACATEIRKCLPTHF
jgi:spore maturation protein CgeB